MTKKQVEAKLKQWGFKVTHYDEDYPDIWEAEFNKTSLDDTEVVRMSESALAKFILKRAYEDGITDGKLEIKRSVKASLGL